MQFESGLQANVVLKVDYRANAVLKVDYMQMQF